MRKPVLLGTGIRNSKDFFGRQQIIEKIFENIGGEQPQSFSIVGERKIGKTSLLYHVCYHEDLSRLPDPERYILVYVDFAGTGDMSSRDEFFVHLMDEVNSIVGQTEALDETSESISSESFRRLIRQEHGKGRKFIFFFDEFDTVVGNDIFNLDFFNSLRSLATNYSVAYVVASRRPLIELTHVDNRASPFFDLFHGHTHRLEVFDETEARDFVVKLANDAGAKEIVDPEFFLQLAGQHPFLLRMVFVIFAESFLKKGQKDADLEEEVETKFGEKSLLFLHAYWNHLDEMRRHVLYSMATGNQGVLKKFEESEIQHALDLLTSDGIILGEGKEQRIITPNFQEWISKQDILKSRVLSPIGPIGPKLQMLMISNRAKLVAKYGPEGFSTLEERISQYQVALLRDAIYSDVVYLDDISQKETDQKSVRDLANAKYYHTEEKVNFLLIIGGDDIVPFYKERDRTGDDEFIYSDDPYVAFSDPERPTIPVGRMPDAFGGPLSLLLNQLDAAIRYHEKKARTKTAIGIAARLWEAPSRMIYICLDPSFDIQDTLKLCPPVGLEVNEELGVTELVAPKMLSDKGFHYYNVHGSDLDSRWVGETRLDSGPCLPEVLSPDLIADSTVRNAIVFSEACFGAYIISKELGESIALQFMDKGALCFIGATATAYGHSGEHGALLCADILAHSFLSRLGEGESSVGQILCRAKEIFDINDEIGRKTVREFVLYGDPTVVPPR